jgi:hypothetical protein
MKKRIGIICAVIISCTVFASFSPSLDGRAVVADEGTFPQGLFAKTIGYLPGDSITVSNLSTKKTADILVVGALDPSEGVAILLSPEAADTLGIEKNSNIIVKITKRSGQLDEAVSGTAVIANGTEETSADTDEVKKSSDTVETTPETVPENSTQAAEMGDTGTGIKSENTAAAAESAPAKTADTAGAPETDAPKETSVEQPVEDQSAKPAGSVVPDTAETPSAAEQIAPEETITATEEPSKAEEPAVAEPVETEEKKPGEEAPTENAVTPETSSDTDTDEAEKVSPVVPSEEEKASESEAGDAAVTEEENAAEPYKENLSDEGTAPAEEKAVELEPAPVTDTESSAEAVTPDVQPEKGGNIETEKVDGTTGASSEPDVAGEPFDEDKTVAPEESAPAVSSPVEDEAPDSEAYAPIILVPSSPNPPASGKNAEQEAAAGSLPSETLAAADSAKEMPAAASAPVSGELDKYTLPNLKSLESGKYYIQIGVFADETNIREIVKKYGKKYPITLVPLVSGKAKQVMVGPLSVDEYAAVTERFKSYGFKDAFLRKIK